MPGPACGQADRWTARKSVISLMAVGRFETVSPTTRGVLSTEEKFRAFPAKAASRPSPAAVLWAIGPIPSRPARFERCLPMRRTVLLLCTAVPLVFAPPALAADKKREPRSVCRVPDVDLVYDTHDLTA